MVFCSHFNSACAATQRKIDNVKVRVRVFIFSNKSAQYNQPPRLAKSEVKRRSAWHISPWREPSRPGGARSSLPARRRAEPDWRFGEGGACRPSSLVQPFSL